MIDLLPYTLDWRDAYVLEAAGLGTVLDGSVELHHIGSTAVPGLIAKPIIDILGAVDGFTDTPDPALEGQGYKAMGAYGLVGRQFYRKQNAAGVRTHHLHLFAIGSPHIARLLSFRDYLRAHPEARAAYATVKWAARAEGSASRTEYQDAKSPFITTMEAEALRWWTTKAP